MQNSLDQKVLKKKKERERERKKKKISQRDLSREPHTNLLRLHVPITPTDSLMCGHQWASSGTVCVIWKSYVHSVLNIKIGFGVSSQASTATSWSCDLIYNGSVSSVVQTQSGRFRWVGMCSYTTVQNSLGMDVWLKLSFADIDLLPQKREKKRSSKIWWIAYANFHYLLCCKCTCWKRQYYDDDDDYSL